MNDNIKDGYYVCTIANTKYKYITKNNSKYLCFAIHLISEEKLDIFKVYYVSNAISENMRFDLSKLGLVVNNINDAITKFPELGGKIVKLKMYTKNDKKCCHIEFYIGNEHKK